MSASQSSMEVEEGGGGEGIETRKPLPRSLEDLQMLREVDALRGLSDEVWNRFVAKYRVLEEQRGGKGRTLVDCYLVGDLRGSALALLPRSSESKDLSPGEVAKDYLALAVFFGIVPPEEENTVHQALSPPMVSTAVDSHTEAASLVEKEGGVEVRKDGMAGRGMETHQTREPRIARDTKSTPPSVLPHSLHPSVLVDPVSGAGEGDTGDGVSDLEEMGVALELPKKRLDRLEKLRKYVDTLCITEVDGLRVMPSVLGRTWETKLVDFIPGICTTRPRAVVGGGDGGGAGEGEGGGEEEDAGSDQLEELVWLRCQRWLPGDGRVVLAIDEVACLRDASVIPRPMNAYAYHSMLCASSKGPLDFAKPLFIGNFLDLHKDMLVGTESPIRGPSTTFYPIALVTPAHMLEALQRHVNPSLTFDSDDGERLCDALHRLQGRPYFFFDCCLSLCTLHSSEDNVIECCHEGAESAKMKLISILRNAWTKETHLRPIISDTLVAILLSSTSPTVLLAHVDESEVATGLGLFAAHRVEKEVLSFNVHAEPLLGEALVEWFLEPPTVLKESVRPDPHHLFQQVLSVSLTTLELSSSDVGPRIDLLLALAMVTRVRQLKHEGKRCTFNDVFSDMLPKDYILPPVVASLPLECVAGKAHRRADQSDRTGVWFGIDNFEGPDWATESRISAHRVPILGQAKVKSSPSLREALPTVQGRPQEDQGAP